MKNVTIYTDGACSGNPGPGGWCSILIYMQNEKTISGHKEHTTNNEMELTAVVSALKELKEPCEVTLSSDSSYVVNAINNKWLDNWRNNGWINSKKKSLPNLELWQELNALLQIHSVSFIWVKGHSNNEYNNRCDRIAVEERDSI